MSGTIGELACAAGHPEAAAAADRSIGAQFAERQDASKGWPASVTLLLPR